MNIYLLTHQRELKKKTNTAPLIANVMGDACKVYIWHRLKPDAQLLKKIATESVALVYPSEESELIYTDVTFDSYIILDGTWQEAQKIYNHSPYLKGLKQVRIESKVASIYTLRRNQKKSGLCTAECAIEILKANNECQQAKSIQDKLITFVAT